MKKLALLSVAILAILILRRSVHTDSWNVTPINTLGSAGQSANGTYSLARTPAGGYPSQALIAEVSPEGDTLWMVAMCTIPLVVGPLVRKRRKPAK